MLPISGAVPAAIEIDDLRGLAAKAARDGLRRMNAVLDPARLEDLTSDLVLVGLVALEKYDPEYGQAASTFAYRRMRPRVVDWYRRTYGDSRSHDPQLDSRSALLLEPRRLRDRIADDGNETGFDSYAAAVERLGRGCSDEGRDTLRRIAPMIVAGLTANEIGGALELRPGEVKRRLERLRDELERVGDLSIPTPKPRSPRGFYCGASSHECPRVSS